MIVFFESSEIYVERSCDAWEWKMHIATSVDSEVSLEKSIAFKAEKVETEMRKVPYKECLFILCGAENSTRY